MSGPEGKQRKISKRALLGGLLGVAGLARTGQLIAAEREGTTATNSFSERDAAVRELQEEGITRHQRGTYRDGNDVLARGLFPFGYRDHAVLDIADATVYAALGTVVDINSAQEQDFEARVQEAETEQERQWFVMKLRWFKSRHDAWRMYLGIPQQNDTFSISRWQPTNGTEDKYYYSLQNVFNAEAFEGMRSVLKEEYKGYSFVGLLLSFIDAQGGERAILGDSICGVMGNFTLTKGSDSNGSYVSYYDRWNLEGSVEGPEGWRGQPYEIYDRIYYNPETLEPLNPQP